MTWRSRFCWRVAQPGVGHTDEDSTGPPNHAADFDHGVSARRMARSARHTSRRYSGAHAARGPGRMADLQRTGSTWRYKGRARVSRQVVLRLLDTFFRHIWLYLATGRTARWVGVWVAMSAGGQLSSRSAPIEGRDATRSSPSSQEASRTRASDGRRPREPPRTPSTRCCGPDLRRRRGRRTPASRTRVDAGPSPLTTYARRSPSIRTAPGWSRSSAHQPVPDVAHRVADRTR